MAKFGIKQGDTAPALQCKLLPSTRSLSGAAVVFNLSKGNTKIVSRAAATIVQVSPPIVKYQWKAGDTALTGTHKAEFEVTYADGTVETFPQEGFIEVNIGDDLD